MKLTFIVVESRIEAGALILDGRVSSFALRASIQASSPTNEFQSDVLDVTALTLYQTGIVTVTYKPGEFSPFVSFYSRAKR